MGAPRKYTPEELDRAVKQYFKSITRKVKLTEQRPTGKKDKMGHEVYVTVPVTNLLGKEVFVTEYLVPPTVGDLSAALGIHRSTWSEYCGLPEFSDTTTYAQGCIHAYLERELLTRSGKDLKGVQFNLENNFGYKQRMELTNDNVEEFLRRALEGEGGCQTF